MNQVKKQREKYKFIIIADVDIPSHTSGATIRRKKRSLKVV